MYRFYVSKTGRDCNSGTAEKPFRTMEKAQIAVRDLIAAGLDAPVTVIVREGIYRTDGIKMALCGLACGRECLRLFHHN